MKKHTTILLLFLLIAVFTTCKKEPDAPAGGNKIEIDQTTIEIVGYYNTLVSSVLNSIGGNETLQHGFCWSIDSKPTINDNKTNLGEIEKPAKFSSTLENLQNNTTYYVRSYVKYKHGEVYGVENSFQTQKTRIPFVTTDSITNITLVSAKCGGTNDHGGLTVSQRGVCWNTDGNPTLENCIDTTYFNEGTGDFYCDLTGLTQGTVYYVVAYATNEKGAGYGKVKQFTTVPIALPEVTTNEITEITINSAISGGNVTSEGNDPVVARGVCWDTIGNPTLEYSLGYTTDGAGVGDFTSDIMELTEGVNYFVKAYATNEKGTGYGEVKQFATLSISLPEVTTADITDITTNSATSGGNVTSNGNGTVTARGVCWNTISNPTLENNAGFTTNGSGTGSFTSQLTGLRGNTIYYVAAYATNKKGTTYGQEKSFFATNNFTDPRDGQSYGIVVIGSQTWFAVNLNYETGNSWCYNNIGNNCNEYGRLYTWEAALTACPTGWHLPNDIEWTNLTGYLGGSNVAGGKMKEIGTEHWNPPNTDATNSSGFTGLPGGWRSTSGEFGSLGDGGNWWLSNESGSTTAWYGILYYTNNNASLGSSTKDGGHSIRCIKD